MQTLLENCKYSYFGWSLHENEGGGSRNPQVGNCLIGNPISSGSEKTVLGLQCFNWLKGLARTLKLFPDVIHVLKLWSMGENQADNISVIKLKYNPWKCDMNLIPHSETRKRWIVPLYEQTLLVCYWEGRGMGCDFILHYGFHKCL